MRALVRILAVVVLLGLIFLAGMNVSSPGRSGADGHQVTTTTAAPATTTTAPPATTTTTAPPATTTTAAPVTTTTAAPAAPTTTAAPSTATTAAPTATTATTAPPAGAAPTDALTDPETSTRVGATTIRRSGTVRQPSGDRPTTREFRRARETAPPIEPPGNAGPRLNLGPLFEPEPSRPATAEAPERGGLATEPLATGGLILGAVAGLLLGLADRAAGLSTRGR